MDIQAIFSSQQLGSSVIVIFPDFGTPIEVCAE